MKESSSTPLTKLSPLPKRDIKIKIISFKSDEANSVDRSHSVQCGRSTFKNVSGLNQRTEGRLVGSIVLLTVIRFFLMTHSIEE